MTEFAELARLAERARSLTQQRDEAIAAAVASGASLRSVAAATGLSHAGVARIVKRTR